MKRIVVELVIKPNLLFYRFKDEIGAEINKTLPDWETNALKIDLFDKKEKLACFLEHKRLAVICDDVKDEDKFFAFLEFVITTYTSKLPLTDILRVGIRHTLLNKTALKYPELVSLFQEKFYPKDKEIEAIVGQKISDAVFSADFERENYKFHYLFGPVSKDEGLAKFGPNTKFELDSEGLSEVMTYLDVDGYKDKDCRARDLNRYITEIRKLVSSTVQESLKLIPSKA